MIVAALVEPYAEILAEYLLAEDSLARETALMAVDAFARDQLAGQITLDDLLALHARASAHLADSWPSGRASKAQRQALRRLTRGEAMPAMLALVLPRQVADEQRAERRWRQEHDRMSAAFDQTGEFVLMFDAQARLDYLNPAFARATGWSLVRFREQAAWAWPVALPMERTEHLDADQRCADGRQFTARWALSPVRDHEGRLLGHVCLGSDVTQQRQVEESLRQNDRLRAIATLAAGIAHDFNNVLGSIIGLTELSQLQAPEGTALARNLAGILQASQRATGLVREMLAFARERAPERSAVSPGSWLRQIEPLLAASLPRHVSLHCEADAASAAWIDAAQIEQVLLNLVKNAGHAMRQSGGEVRVLGDDWRDPEGRTWCRLRVIDRGEGIAPEVLPRIFDPFFTTKPVDEGTGLGLSAAYGIVRRHAGELLVDSEWGSGTVMTLLLPLLSPAVESLVDAGPLASWYELDASDRVCAVSADWDRMAAANQGEQALAARVLGRPLAEMVQGDQIWAPLQQALLEVRHSGQSKRLRYRCDGPELMRHVEMCLEPRQGGVVRISHRLVSAAHRDSLAPALSLQSRAEAMPSTGSSGE